MKTNLEDRSKAIRLSILDTLYSVGKGHIGGCMSCVDILTALYYEVLRYNVANPYWEHRDRFILSKGHAALALYTVLADVGFISKNDLTEFNSGGTIGEHPDYRIFGVEATTGSLGHGLGIASGIAYAAKLDHNPFFTYILLGDGECYEGSVWEAAMFAGHHGLDNLIVIIDRNQYCISGNTEVVLALDPLASKFTAFGWLVEYINGHDFHSIIDSCTHLVSHKPKLIIANTIKGKGISFMENKCEWHHGGLTKEQYDKAREDILNGYA